jgi:hypothetical protein
MSQVSLDVPCTPHHEAAGLAGRTAALVKRDANIFPRMTETFYGGKGGGPQTITAAMLAAALKPGADEDTDGRAWNAAFLIGRCRAEDDQVDARLDEVLQEAIRAKPQPDVAIELAMSLALRGQPGAARGTLERLAMAKDKFSDGYRAAYYLAQLGDITGYPTLVRTIRDELGHFRVMAARHVLAFVLYDGDEIDGMKIDPRGLLVERLGDPEPIVRQEIPGLLVEAEMKGLRALIDPLTEDADPNVKAAAKRALETAPPTLL